MTGQLRVQWHGGEDAGVVQVQLSHPGKLNAMSRAMWRQLREVFLALQQRPEARCVVISGEGGHFCAGGDIAEYPDFRYEEAALRHFHEEEVWGGLSAMLACDVPLVACIEGACMGAGVEIASTCDLRLSSASASFGAPIAKLGFPMAPRELALVRAAAGELSTRQMLLEAATLDAPTLLARGFLSRLLPDDQVQADARDTARRIAGLAPQAARLNKQTLRALASPFPEGLLDSAYAYADSAEHREGISAFLAKRRAQF
ncbi:enoyl-CoA hydratase/isomerase family protein [Curvibacter sp. HBC28]|uniref:Enoyl-CoA hydratase/isomerase family protein n=1 Tax=Curvibacter microcysteis TaxID=3026419 RepID=A0ABT5MGJ7_9BURK|nr:enoyl-CoA hydratase/isomerase family protein [Curvibacter sp. HBC28]MDD0814216.1 enoyl-CoA hydratase/isomerase family protein [Curvibacter sp. HBC28]